jgi:hypothetical protein
MHIHFLWLSFIPDLINKLLEFLRNRQDVNLINYRKMFHVRPILSGSDLRVIQIEILCSFLLGSNGNQGFWFVGCFTRLSREEIVEHGK